jgi:hypothetical protein
MTKPKPTIGVVLVNCDQHEEQAELLPNHVWCLRYIECRLCRAQLPHGKGCRVEYGVYGPELEAVAAKFVARVPYARVFPTRVLCD